MAAYTSINCAQGVMYDIDYSKNIPRQRTSKEGLALKYGLVSYDVFGIKRIEFLICRIRPFVGSKVL